MGSTTTLGFAEGIGMGEWLLLLLIMGVPAYWVWWDTGRRPIQGDRLWVVLVLYTGPVGLSAYLLFRKRFRRSPDDSES